MRKIFTKSSLTILLGAGALLAVTAPAGALTLGSTTLPPGATTSACGPGLIGQFTSDPSTPYMVPTGGGSITGWSTNTVGSTAGAPITFVVLRSDALIPNDYDVVGADSQSIPNPLPASGIATFAISSPIGVAGGETLGLWNKGAASTCYFRVGSVPSGDSLFALTAASTPAAGQTLAPASANSPSQFTMDLAATLAQSADAAVASAPGSGVAGRLGILSSTVTNNGPTAQPIAFTDTVAAGVAIAGASASGGSCTVAGQTATCNLGTVPIGQSVTVDLFVTPSAAGSFLTSASVALPAGVSDTNSANNNTTAILTAAAAPVPAPSVTCTVPALTGITTALAKQVLKSVHCGLGKVSSAHSKRVKKGAVISTTPGAGVTGPSGMTVKLTVSSGPPKKKRKGHKKH